MGDEPTDVVAAVRGDDDRLATALESFVESRVVLQNTLDAEIAAGKRRRRAYVIAVATAIIALVIFGRWLAGVAGDARAASKSNGQILQRFDECTTPTPTVGEHHECYEQGQATQAKAVGDLTEAQIRASAYAVECVIAGQVDVLGCVRARFAGGERPAPATTNSGTTTTVPAQQRAIAAFGPSSTSSGTTTTTTTTRLPTVTTTVPTTPPSSIPPCDLDLKVFCLNQPKTCGSMLPCVKSPTGV